MTKFFLTAFVILSNFLIASPVLFYKTYTDYKNKKGINKGEYKEMSIQNAGATVRAIENGKKVNYTSKELAQNWGFEIEGVLYRYVKNTILEVLHVGDKSALYQLGQNRMVAGNDYKFGDNALVLFYFSNTTDFEPTLLNTTLKGKVKENLREKYPYFSTLFDSLELIYQNRKTYSPIKVLKAFTDFDSSK